VTPFFLRRRCDPDDASSACAFHPIADA